MSKEDYYKTLGVSKGATADEIKSAFRKKAMKYHPDRNKGDKNAEHKFKELNEAYEILKDKQKRAQYDQFGHSGPGAGGFGGFGGQAQGGAGGFGGFQDFSDVFNDIFGDFMGQGQGASQSQKRSMAQNGEDLRYDIEIALEDAFSGIKQDISFKTDAKCEACDGKGAKNPSDMQTCTTCNGAGRVRMQQGFFMIERTCSTCKGVGKIIKNPCKTCNGSGRVMKNRKLSVQIPAGIENGMKMRIAGEGEAGLRGGAPGDLYVFVHIKNHELFKRENHNLHCTVPIKMTTAVLGGTVEIPSIDGHGINVKIPEGSQSGSSLRLRGKGMPVLKSGRFGDLIITLKVETPKNLSKEQKEVLRNLDEHLDAKSTPDSVGFINKVKKFFKF